MSNFEETKDSLKGYIRAGVPFVVIRSAERHRVERAARELVRENNFNIFYYTDARQIQKIGFQGASSSKNVDSDPLSFANDLFSKTRHVTVVLGDTRKLGQDSLYTRELLGTLQLALETRNTIVAIAAEDIWPRLSRFGLFITMDFPDYKERRQLITEFSDAQGGLVAWDEQDVCQVTTLTRGLSEVQIVNLLRSSLASKGALSRSDIYEIGTKKELLFTPASNVIPVAANPGLRVAGLENLKSWLEIKREVLFAPDAVLREFNLDAPKGILLVGIPGCGKSFSARIIASKWELPLFRFDIGTVYNKYVGETERAMQESLEYIDNVAPCVLWVDEIEKALSASSGESDVGNRILGQFLFWLQESKARVFLVATANDITKLPPELFRKGRFSEIFFVDLPNRRERAEAIKLYISRSFDIEYSLDDLLMLADCSEGFSYSDIEQAIKGVAECVAFRSAPIPDAQSMAAHLGTIVPISAADDRIESIRAWGKEHAVSASMEVE